MLLWDGWWVVSDEYRRRRRTSGREEERDEARWGEVRWGYSERGSIYSILFYLKRPCLRNGNLTVCWHLAIVTFCLSRTISLSLYLSLPQRGDLKFSSMPYSNCTVHVPRRSIHYLRACHSSPKRSHRCICWDEKGMSSITAGRSTRYCTMRPAWKRLCARAYGTYCT